ncbi:MAG: sigma-70 family RNA polymerase sigma factor [Planctomycetes bacterium]|nr:sigma-70 family RNA polymerase sigma factor [Planctomycetota bacterium]
MPPEAAVDDRQRSEAPAAVTAAEVLRVTAAVARGDPEAFGAFYEAWFDRAYAMARSLTRRDESFCLDVVQDVMLRVVRSLRPMDGEELLARWVARVVHTTALDHLRREARRARREECVAAARGAAAPEGVASKLELDERVAWLEARLAEASEEDRALLRARFGEGKTLEQAGKALGMTGDAAHGRIRRVVERLRSLAREAFRE